MADQSAAHEEILEPELPIIDPHHHLWDRRAAVAGAPPPSHPFDHVFRQFPLYLVEDLLADMRRGHNVFATVFVECGAMYRPDGPVEFRPVGETEFITGVAKQAEAGAYGGLRPCAGIVGHTDLSIGARARAVLESHLEVSGGRFSGIRHKESWDPDPNVLGPLVGVGEGLYREARFREGFAQLAPLGLSFDAWLLETQLADLIDLARAFPETSIILCHVGTPLGIASYAGRREERFPTWREKIRTLARCENVSVKLGGLGMAFPAFPSYMSAPPAPSAQLAREWRPYIETCIEAFGADRCMFESNFPVDALSCTYDVLWNAFKLIAKGCSAEEKAALFAGTAAKVYRMQVTAPAR